MSKYIKGLCRAHSSCVDTFTLYLTGPSNSDGSLLFWDTTGKGLMTENGMLYTPKELFDDLKNCSAKRIFIVADYSYAGVMMNKMKSRMLRHRRHFRNVLVMSSASVGEYSLGSDFTFALINQSRTGNHIKCVREVFQVSTNITITISANEKYTVSYFEQRGGLAGLSGGSCSVLL